MGRLDEPRAPSGHVWRFSRFFNCVVVDLRRKWGPFSWSVDKAVIRVTEHKSLREAMKYGMEIVLNRRTYQQKIDHEFRDAGIW